MQLSVTTYVILSQLLINGALLNFDEHTMGAAYAQQD
jgi:hypothetical protein